MSNATFHDLKDKSVFITGGGSGIGAALTEGFLRQGAKVGFIGKSDATEFCDRMEQETGTRPLFVQGDITDTPVLQQAIRTVSEAHGPVTVLVNNAANDQRHQTLDVTEDFWDWSQAVNLRAYFFACQAVIPEMQKAGGGSIVNFSSTSYMMGNGGYPAYTAANGGITAMTRSLARDFGPDRIRVNAIAPGWVLTERQLEKWATKEALAAHLDRQCLKDHMEPQDVVEAVQFLSSDTSRMMTGQCIAVDGGVVTVAA